MSAAAAAGAAAAAPQGGNIVHQLDNMCSHRSQQFRQLSQSVLH